MKRFKHKFFFGIKHMVMASISIFISIFFALIIMPMPKYNDCFRTVYDLQCYAKKINENTPPENNDTLRPEFTNYYKSQIPTFFQKILYKITWILTKIKLIKPPAWDTSAFRKILEDLGIARQQSGMKNNFVSRVQTKQNSKIIIFGNLQGSFHSFVRCIEKLKELGIIDENFKITNPQNYIVWMGDVVDRSPFTLETLTAVMKFLQVNPNNAIYLRGNHETNNYWQEHTLKIELQIRMVHLSTDAIPLEMEINKFFNTLPLAIYFSIPSDVSEFVRMSDAGRDGSNILNEHNFADMLIKKTETDLTNFELKDGMATSQLNVKIKAIIRGEKKRKTFQKNEGLRYLPPDLDSVAWTMLSCPNVTYQKALDFYSDAFAIINASEKLTDWEITLYTRDLRTKDPFKEIKYNFISGLDIETHKKIGILPQTQQQVAVQTVPQQQIQQQPQLLQEIPENENQFNEVKNPPI